MSSGQNLSRRKFGAAVGLGAVAGFGGAYLLRCFCETIQVIPVRVVWKGGTVYEMEPINAIVPKGVTKLRFVSVTKAWSFKEQIDDGGDYGAAPRIWTVGENPNDPKVVVKPQQNNRVIETNKVPQAVGKKVHPYFVMTFGGNKSDLSAAEIAALGPLSPGDCGGGGDVDSSF